LPYPNKNTIDRGCTRVPKDVPIEVKKLVYPVSSKAGEKSTTVNIAQQGICFTVSSSYETGDTLSINMKLKGMNRHRNGLSAVLNDELTKTDTLTVLAEVVWVQESVNEKGYDVGVKFINVYEDDIVALEKYFSALLPGKK